MVRFAFKQCKKCQGTGINRPRSFRRKKHAYECKVCGGTGCIKEEYVAFSGKKHVKGIDRVFEEGGPGTPYEEWWNRV